MSNLRVKGNMGSVTMMKGGVAKLVLPGPHEGHIVLVKKNRCACSPTKSGDSEALLVL